jgi:polyisoprenoid-binding protein YceI
MTIRRRLSLTQRGLQWLRPFSLVAAAAASADTAIAAQARPLPDVYEINPIHSRVEFTVPFMGLTDVKGSFESYGGSLLLDERQLDRSSVTVVIEAASIHTGNSARDKHLASDDFLDVQRFPSVVFQSDRLEAVPNGFVIHGKLTLHGVTRAIGIPIRLRHPVRHDSDIDYAGFDGAITLNWRDFAIRATNLRNSWFDPARMLFDDSVRVSMSVEAVRRRPLPSTYAALAAGMALLRSEGPSAVAARYTAAKSVAADSALRIARPFADMANILLREGRTTEALELLRLNVDAHPGDGDALAALAFGQLRGGSREAAVQAYIRAIAVDSLQPEALEMLRWLRR